MKTNYLVCYDISDPERLVRVFRFMKARALHLQYSVFIGLFDWRTLNDVKGSLRDLINPGKDDIRIYPLPSASLVAVLGVGGRVPEGADLFTDGRSLTEMLKSCQAPLQGRDFKNKKEGVQ